MKKLTPFWLLVLHFCAVFSTTKAQIISTVAGNGTGAFSGDGAAATAASITTTGGLFIDSLGNLYIADQTNERIRKIDTAGIITTIAGNGISGFSGDGGAASAAEFILPGDILVGSDGKMYVSDLYSNRVRAIVGGIITTIAGNGSSGYSGDGGQATAASLDQPCGLCTDRTGKIYIGCSYAIRVFDPSTGRISTCVGNGVPGFTGDGGPATNAQFDGINFFSIDTAGNFYVTDNGNHRLRKVNSAGIVSTIAGTGTLGFSGDGGPATNAELQYPSGAISDRKGNIYIADAINYRIRKIDTAGIISTYAGTGVAAFNGDGIPSNTAQLDYPQDFAFDRFGNLYFNDLMNYRTRMISNIQGPRFVGASHLLQVCKDSAAKPINTLLALTDSTFGLTETWSIISAPFNGSLGGFSAATTSSGGITTPAGLTYASHTGYTGPDSFRIKVSNGYNADSIDIIVNVVNCRLGVSPVIEPSASLSVFPNPSNGSFELYSSLAGNSITEINISDPTGRTVYTTPGHVDFPVKVALNVPQGLYMVCLKSATGVTWSKLEIVR